MINFSGSSPLVIFSQTFDATELYIAANPFVINLPVGFYNIWGAQIFGINQTVPVDFTSHLTLLSSTGGRIMSTNSPTNLSQEINNIDSFYPINLLSTVTPRDMMQPATLSIKNAGLDATQGDGQFVFKLLYSTYSI
jgi:hypothetical protein